MELRFKFSWVLLHNPYPSHCGMPYIFDESPMSFQLSVGYTYEEDNI